MRYGSWYVKRTTVCAIALPPEVPNHHHHRFKFSYLVMQASVYGEASPATQSTLRLKAKNLWTP